MPTQFSIITTYRIDADIGMNDLTTNQHRVLQYLLSRMFKGESLPNAREIADHFSLKSATSGYGYLKALKKRGYVALRQRGSGAPTDIALTKKAVSLLSISPLILGYIPAGDLSEFGPEADDEQNKFVTIRKLIPQARPGDFLVQVKGESMIDAGIQDGQYALIRPTIKPRQGDICAVWVDSIGGTLKQIFQEEDTVRLVPANSNYQTQIFPSSEVKIQGVLIATIDIQSYPRKR